MTDPVLAGNALVSLVEQKRYQQIPDSQTIYDSILIEIINEVSDDLIRWLGISVGSTVEYVEYYRGRGGRSLVLRHYPVVSIESVSINGVAQSVASLDVDLAAGIVRVPWNAPTVFSPGFVAGDCNVEVKYTAGLATAPENVKMAAKRYIKGLFDARSKDADMSTAQQVDEIAKLRNDVREQLNDYRRVVLT